MHIRGILGSIFFGFCPPQCSHVKGTCKGIPVFPFLASVSAPAQMRRYIQIYFAAFRKQDFSITQIKFTAVRSQVLLQMFISPSNVHYFRYTFARYVTKILLRHLLPSVITFLLMLPSLG